MARAALEPGDVVGGYRLGAVLGVGGLGTVFATEDAGGAPLAIKVVAHGGDPALQKRVAREVAALGRIDHPHVLRLVDAGADEAWSYLVMPRIEGTSLRELVRGGPLSPETASLLVRDAARGVGAIHRAGLCHRDLKPDNIMIDGAGRVVIIDLGLALAPDWSRQTSEGAIAGSLPYMAPEQIEGDASPPSDVWALAVTWWELATGKRPFARDRAVEEVAAIAGGARPALAEVERRAGDDTAALIERCLSRDPAARPPHGAALADELARVLPEDVRASGGGLTRLCRDRTAWEAEVAERVAARCAEEAGALASSGDVFAAMRALDRGLAYRPEDPALHALLSRVMPPGGVATATGTPRQPTTLPGPRHRRRWIAAGAVLAGAGGLAAALALSPGGSASAARYDFADPRAVAQAVIDAVRSGDPAQLQGLCIDDSEESVERICEARPEAPIWPRLRDLFQDAIIDGVYRTADGATLNLRLGPGGRRAGVLELWRRRERYYLRSMLRPASRAD